MLARWRDPARVLERATGLRVLAEIPVGVSGMAPSPPDEAFLEGVRFLRAALQTLPGGGRSFAVVYAGRVACAAEVTGYLAKSFGEAGRTVLLDSGLASAPPGLGNDRVKVKTAGEEKRPAADIDVSGPLTMAGWDADGKHPEAQAVVLVDAADARPGQVDREVRSMAERGRVAGLALLKRR